MPESVIVCAAKQTTKLTPGGDEPAWFYNSRPRVHGDGILRLTRGIDPFPASGSRRTRTRLSFCTLFDLPSGEDCDKCGLFLGRAAESGPWALVV